MLKLNLTIEAKTHAELITLLNKTIDTISDKEFMHHETKKTGSFNITGNSASGNNLDCVFIPENGIEQPLTDLQTHMIKSFVGLNNNPNQQKEFYRNRFSINSNDTANVVMQSLVNLGLAKHRQASGDLNDYFLTPAGLREARKLAKYKDTFPEQPKESD